MIQVAIIENTEPFLHDLTYLIEKEQDMSCLLCAGSIAEFYQSLELAHAPDILLINQDLGTVNSVEHLEKIYKLMPGIPVIIMSGNENLQMIRKSLLLGVSGYFFKGKGAALLVAAIRDVLGGQAYLSPKASKIAIDMIRRHSGDTAHEPQPDKISMRLPWNAKEREINVIRGLIDGKSYKEIAASNFMTIDGVRYYVRSIYPKLGVSTRDQLVRALAR